MTGRQPTSHSVLENGIYQIVMHESSRRAVDAWLIHMTDLMYKLYLEGNNTYAPVLLDIREPGMMPVAYATHAVQLWAEAYPNPPLIDIAIVYRYGLLAHLAVTFAHLSRQRDGVRLFHKGRYNEAVYWLESRMSTYYDQVS
jgi:hypothetical protein